MSSHSPEIWSFVESRISTSKKYSFLIIAKKQGASLFISLFGIIGNIVSKIEKFLNVIYILHVINEVNKMVSITLAVPHDLKAEMEKHPEFNWSEIARKAIRDKLDLLKKMDSMFANSRLTEEDALRIGNEINKAVAKKYKERL